MPDLSKALMLGCFLLLAVLWGGCNPAQTVTNIAQPAELPGQKLFESNCASCHGLQGQGNMPILQTQNIRFNDPTWQKQHTDAQIRHTIQAGRGMMPAFASTFTEQELQELISYIRTLSPSPPSKHTGEREYKHTPSPWGEGRVRG